MSCTKVGLFKVSISFETLYYTQYQGRVCTTSKASYKHMYMHDIHRGYSSFWSEYEFYFIERSEKNLYFMSAEGTNEIYNFSLHEMK